MRIASKIVVLSIAFGMAAAYPAAAQVPVAQRTVDEAAIAEAVLRWEFQNNHAAKDFRADYYFIGFGSASDPKDPSPEFLKRFAGNSPAVKPASACRRTPDGALVDRETGKPGILFLVESIRWVNPDNVYVRDGAVASSRYSSSGDRKLVREPYAWAVSSGDSTTAHPAAAELDKRKEDFKPSSRHVLNPMTPWYDRRSVKANADPPPVVWGPQKVQPTKPPPKYPSTSPTQPVREWWPGKDLGLPKPTATKSQEPAAEEKKPAPQLPYRRETASGFGHEDPVPTGPTRAEDETAIVEVVFRFLFQNSALARGAQAESYFIGIGSASKARDPGPDFLMRFAGQSPVVKAASASKRISSGIVVDRVTLRPGAVFRVEGIRWIHRNEVEVRCGCTVSSRPFSTEDLTVDRLNGVWTVAARASSSQTHNTQTAGAVPPPRVTQPPVKPAPVEANPPPIAKASQEPAKPLVGSRPPADDGIASGATHEPPRKTDPSQVGDYAAIVEAVFRCQFENSETALTAQADFYYIGIGSPSDPSDPGADLLRRFAGHSPAVKAVSACQRAANGVVLDRTFRSPGVLFRVERIRWVNGDEVDVQGGCTVSSRSSSTEVFRVIRQNGGWTVTSTRAGTMS